jgi:hypothetical protein
MITELTNRIPWIDGKVEIFRGLIHTPPLPSQIVIHDVVSLDLSEARPCLTRAYRFNRVNHSA